MANIREVSKLAQVSVATVSRVINGNKWVSDSTRDKVLAAMKELGYQPNSMAKALATNRSDILGMVVSDLGGPFFGDMMHFAETAVRQEGKHLIITSGHEALESERDAIDFLLKRQVDALLLHVDVISDEALIELSDNHKQPLVLINRIVPELSDQCIALDNELGGYLATQHLIQLGHKSIACVTGPLFKSDARARLAGYRRALTEANLPYEDHLVIESDYQEAGGQAAIARLHRRGKLFTGVFAHNDHMAIGAMKELQAYGLNVPTDVSIVGYDDMVMARYTTPALTTITIPVGEFGEQAARLALRMLGQVPADTPIQHRFEPILVQRESTAPAP